MNITNQINAGLNDVRSTLIDLSCLFPRDGTITGVSKARYQLELIIQMIRDHVEYDKSIPWSERKGMVEEEFSSD